MSLPASEGAPSSPAPQFRVGDRVELQHVVHRPGFNGQQGLISTILSRRWYRVDLDPGAGPSFTAKAENLKLLAFAAPVVDTVAAAAEAAAAAAAEVVVEEEEPDVVFDQHKDFFEVLSDKQQDAIQDDRYFDLTDENDGGQANGDLQRKWAALLSKCVAYAETRPNELAQEFDEANQRAAVANDKASDLSMAAVDAEARSKIKMAEVIACVKALKEQSKAFQEEMNRANQMAEARSRALEKEVLDANQRATDLANDLTKSAAEAEARNKALKRDLRSAIDKGNDLSTTAAKATKELSVASMKADDLKKIASEANGRAIAAIKKADELSKIAAHAEACNKSLKKEVRNAKKRASAETDRANVLFKTATDAVASSKALEHELDGANQRATIASSSASDAVASSRALAQELRDAKQRATAIIFAVLVKMNASAEGLPSELRLANATITELKGEVCKLRVFKWRLKWRLWFCFSLASLLYYFFDAL